MPDRALLPVAAALLLLFAGSLALDLGTDAGAGADVLHLVTEATGALAALLGAALLLHRLRREQAEAARWRARSEELLAGVGATVERQLAAWGLSEAEAEVALLLLKGLSFKEIAAVRATSDRTAREQASAIYRKAGVAGRAELSAWFLEDRMAPGG